MTELVFVDTNIFVYARDSTEQSKQQQALKWLSVLWQQRTGRTSYQVLNEYYVTVTQRLTPGLSRSKARIDIDSLFAWKPLPTDRATIERAWNIQDRYQLSWWDSLVVASAKLQNTTRLISEDFQHGQDLDGVRIVNPFLEAPN